MPAIPVKLKDRREIASGTMAFYLEKPPGFQFMPGQFIDFKLSDPPENDAEGSARAFSIASAPHEADLVIATRMRDTAMKRCLKTISLGAKVEVDGPFGNLALHTRASRPAVLIAGGIGITPFRSIVLDAARNKLPHRIWLFYSNRRPEDAPFLEELQQAEGLNPNYTLIATMTDMQKSARPWKGRTGVINKQLLSQVIGDLEAPIYYLAGPPGMLNAMQQVLVEGGVVSDDIRAEEFAGY